jgi:hypothetical protein
MLRMGRSWAQNYGIGRQWATKLRYGLFVNEPEKVTYGPFTGQDFWIWARGLMGLISANNGPWMYRLGL